MTREKAGVVGCVALCTVAVAFAWDYQRRAISGKDGVKEGEKEELSLKIEPAVVDLGKVITNEKINFAAAIRNHGKRPVNLGEIQPSCGCTSVSLTKRTCQPKEEVLLCGTLEVRKPGKFGI